MVDVLIEVDDDILAVFKLKVELKGRSLEDELRAVLEAAAD